MKNLAKELNFQECTINGVHYYHAENKYRRNLYTIYMDNGELLNRDHEDNNRQLLTYLRNLKAEREAAAQPAMATNEREPVSPATSPRPSSASSTISVGNEWDYYGQLQQSSNFNHSQGSPFKKYKQDETKQKIWQPWKYNSPTH